VDDVPKLGHHHASGGLWHGASWNFVIWGGYHGALLSVERFFRGNRPIREEWDWLYPVKAISTFGLVLISWVFLSGGRSTAEHANPGPDVLPPRRAHTSSALARGAGSSRAGPGGGGREARLVRADRRSARVGLRHRAGGDVPVPGSVRRDRRLHSVHLLPVFRADVAQPARNFCMAHGVL